MRVELEEEDDGWGLWMDESTGFVWDVVAASPVGRHNDAQASAASPMMVDKPAFLIGASRVQYLSNPRACGAGESKCNARASACHLYPLPG